MLELFDSSVEVIVDVLVFHHQSVGQGVGVFDLLVQVVKLLWSEGSWVG